MAPAIRVENLSKRYRITQAGQQVPYRTLRESLIQGASTLVRRPRRGESGRRVEDFWALKGVDFEVNPGEVVGVIGRNGAGKSTLLKILSRITEPTDGRVRLRGRVGSLLEVGTGFHPELSGRENVYLNGAILGMSRRDIARKFDEIVAFAEVGDFLDTPVKRYSSGMYVRLAFAVAAHLETEILIIDEVLAVGDSSFQRKCLGKVRSLAQGGDRTVLFVSHNLTTVRSLCSRVISLKSGSITWDGDVGPAVEQYLTEDLGDDRMCFDVGDTWRNHVKETPVRLLRIAFNEGQPLRHGEPMTIDIDYRTNRAVEAVSFGIGFSNLEGSRIMTIDTDIPGERRLNLPAGVTGRIRIVDHTNFLQPSRYALVAGSRSGNFTLDYLPHFAHIEVLEGDTTPAVIVGRNEAGSVRKPVDWSHEIVGDVNASEEGGTTAAGVRIQGLPDRPRGQAM